MLRTALVGCASYDTKQIYFSDFDSFYTVLHEICHMYLYLVGIDELKEIEKELACDIFGRTIYQLMFENGDNILAKLKEFAYE